MSTSNLGSTMERQWRTWSWWVRFKSWNIKGDQLVAKRKGERFKRIKCSTLAKLLQENNNEESVYHLADQSDNPVTFTWLNFVLALTALSIRRAVANKWNWSSKGSIRLRSGRCPLCYDISHWCLSGLSSNIRYWNAGHNLEHKVPASWYAGAWGVPAIPY